MLEALSRSQVSLVPEHRGIGMRVTTAGAGAEIRCLLAIRRQKIVEESLELSHLPLLASQPVVKLLRSPMALRQSILSWARGMRPSEVSASSFA